MFIEELTQNPRYFFAVVITVVLSVMLLADRISDYLLRVAIGY